MAHNSRRNRRDVTTHDDDDYVYPTKKSGNHTRNRRHDFNLIKAGLTDLENIENDSFEEGEADDTWYDDTPMASDEDIAAEMDDVFELNDVNTDWDHRWEDY